MQSQLSQGKVLLCGPPWGRGSGRRVEEEGSQSEGTHLWLQQAMEGGREGRPEVRGAPCLCSRHALGAMGSCALTMTHLSAPHFICTPSPPAPHILTCAPHPCLCPTSSPALCPHLHLYAHLYSTSSLTPHIPTTLLWSFCWLSSLSGRCALECGGLNRLQCVGGLWGYKEINTG